MKGRYVADLFSGSGGVAEACRAEGCAAREWDVLHGPCGDLTRKDNLRGLRQNAKSGRVSAAMLGPPCSSFSTARDSSGVIRTS